MYFLAACMLLVELSRAHPPTSALDKDVLYSTVQFETDCAGADDLSLDPSSSPGLPEGQYLRGASVAVSRIDHGCAGFWGWDVGGLALPPVDSFGVTLNSPVLKVTTLHIDCGCEPIIFHSADTNDDFQIDLHEALRVIQLYNGGSFHCESGGSEDGYAPGPGSHGCAPHSSDYAPRDWKIQLSELLRLIQLYRLGYNFCGDTEDAFCPGWRP